MGEQKFGGESIGCRGGGGGGGAVFPGWERMSKFKASEGTHHHPPQ